MPHWQQLKDYDFIKNCRPELIAWEFLRRNPHYQKDYQQFITTWRALEQQYDVAPNRDFNTWKKDTRAYTS